MQRSNEELGVATRMLLLPRDYHDKSSAVVARQKVFYGIIEHEFIDTASAHRWIVEIAQQSTSPLEIADVVGAIGHFIHPDLRADVIKDCFGEAMECRNSSSPPGLFLGALEMINTYPLVEEVFHDGWMGVMSEGHFKEASPTPALSGRLSQALGLYLQNIWFLTPPNKRLKFLLRSIATPDHFKGYTSHPNTTSNFHEYLGNEVMGKLLINAPAQFKAVLLSTLGTSLGLD